MNPWETILLSDYENHMGLEEVGQLQAMNTAMKMQLGSYGTNTAMILGVAGGNGLEHVMNSNLQKVYGVDVNAEYLKLVQLDFKNEKIEGASML